MIHMASVRVTVTVSVSPAVAFEVFTQEIGQWYRKGVARLPTDRSSSGVLRFEGGEGGRLVEEDLSDGRCVERATVTVWDAGERLVFVDRRATEVDVLFEPIEGGTRVVLEHRGLDRLPPDAASSAAKHGWRRLAGWFEQHVNEEMNEVQEGRT
jgi:hypothetical protein